MVIKIKESKKETEEVPLCEKCGNLMIEESLDNGRGKEWVCPHCQGEIDFLADEEDE